MITKNFSQLTKTIKLHISEALKTPNSIKKTIPKHIVANRLKKKHKNEILEVRDKDRHISFKDMSKSNY